MKSRTKKWSVVLVAAMVVSVALAGTVLGLARADSDEDQESNWRGFATFGTAKRIEFLDNEVIRIDTFVTGTFGGVSVRLGVPIGELDRKISFSSFLVNIDCSGGSPRIQLAVDTDGDGVSNGNAFGYMGPAPSFTGCAQQVWQVNDMTDAVERWDITQFGGPFYNTFAEIVTFFAAFPDHKVVSGTLVQDAFAPVMQGLAYYDDIQIGRRTLG